MLWFSFGIFHGAILCAVLIDCQQLARCVLKDSFGDTALHDAIGKDNKEIVEMLVAHPGIDFTLRSKRGFNVLHHAALKGNNQ